MGVFQRLEKYRKTIKTKAIKFWICFHLEMGEDFNQQDVILKLKLNSTIKWQKWEIIW